MEYNQFQNLLSSDIRLSRQIKPINHKHLQVMIQEEEINYFFEKEYVIRKSVTQDTFDIPVKSISLNLKQIENKNFTILRLKTTLLGQEIVIFEDKETAIADEINNYFLK